MKREQFNREWKQYIDGFYENYERENDFSSNDFVNSAYYIGIDMSKGRLNRHDMSRIMRYLKNSSTY
ncbi:hypothetical protein [Clostridium sp. M14]|uniref:hypothetical protein n=1 Tax=Clostridium sp. M14 TaxID=2716311 RepID=UPI0013EEDE3B|nr:hypothetical protein [Clostridium sp. M14]MBZ9693404.1 hypothetical protein [Clostridium sp. M14]